MRSPVLFQRLVILPLAAAILLLVMAPAQAERVTAKLQVSAQVVVSCRLDAKVSCRLDAKVPPVGTEARRSGGASFSVQCTRGATAALCAEACGSLHAENTARNEQHVGVPQADGTTVATVLF